MGAPVYSPSQIEMLTDTGRRLGMALGHYLVWTGREARQRARERVYFLSREGAWFAREYEAIRQRSANAADYPVAEYLPVSRRSTYLPSFASVSMATFEPMLAQYGRASIRTVCESVGFSSRSNARLDAENRDIRIDWDAPWSNGGAEAALPFLMPEFERHRSEQRPLLLEFLAARGIGRDRSILVADIGWRGTIHDNLARLMPDTLFEGFYFHLQPYFVRQLPNTRKFGFLNAGGPELLRQSRRLRFGAPLEFAVSFEKPTVLSYDREGSDVVAVYDEELRRAEAVTNIAATFRNALSSGVSNLTFDSAIDPRHALDETLAYLERPVLPIVDLFFTHPRDDRFGGGVIRGAPPRLTVAALLAALVNSRRRQWLGRALAESGWPWGLLHRDLPMIAPLLSRLMRLLDPQLSRA